MIDIPKLRFRLLTCDREELVNEVMQVVYYLQEERENQTRESGEKGLIDYIEVNASFILRIFGSDKEWNFGKKNYWY